MLQIWTNQGESLRPRVKHSERSLDVLTRRLTPAKPVFCYQLLAEGSMEEKIYSRAQTKTALSELVLDEKNIERMYSRRELDLLQESDTWVICKI
jgi:hypothetical protein